MNKLLKLIDDSKPLVMANLLSTIEEKKDDDDFAIFTPVNMALETVFIVNNFIVRILKQMERNMNLQI